MFIHSENKKGFNLLKIVLKLEGYLISISNYILFKKKKKIIDKLFVDLCWEKHLQIFIEKVYAVSAYTQ